MRIAILSFPPHTYSDSRLIEAGKARGHTVTKINISDLSLYIENDKPSILYSGRALSKPDVIIPRVSAARNSLSTLVVSQFETMGVFTTNCAQGISIARNKFLTLQILRQHNIPVPPSVYVYGNLHIPAALEQIESSALIIKLLNGTQGVGVMLAESSKNAEAIIETLNSTQHEVLAQKFVAESKGRDIRAFVIGEKVVAAMQRIAKPEEFRSNVHRGAATEALDLSPELEKIAVQAAKAVGLNIAGVDIVESDKGPLVIEVNSSPGLEGIEGATAVDIATAVIEYIELCKTKKAP